MPANSEMPNLFVIGAMKCGTTSLHYYLGLHPEISMSSVKEPKYFLGHLPSDPRRPRVGSGDEYLALFEPGTAVRGEASVAYSACHQFPGVSARIAQETRDTKLIYLVRDPIERVVSSIRFEIAEGSRPDPGVGATPDIASILGDPENPGNDLIARGLYMTQLREYLRFFGPESIRVVDSDALRGDREATLSSLFDFVGVDPDFRDHRFVRERNSHTSFAVGGLNLRLRNSSVLRWLSYGVPEDIRRGAIRRLKRLTGKDVAVPPLGSELRDRLEAVFQPEVEELRELTGQHFAGWSI